MPATPSNPAPRVAAFLVDQVKRHAGPRWNQGPRKQPFALGTGGDEALELVSTRRLFGVNEPSAKAVCAWHRGERPVDLIEHIPTARQMLGQQARGRRFVSVLPDATALSHGDPRHPNGLTFALHDLCHLEKFVDPEHHLAQVGFFRALERAMDSAGWPALEEGFDSRWAADRDYVLADMNGSALFLFAALKMKLKMAVRRNVAAAADDERDAYTARRDDLLRLLGLGGPDAAAAREVSARRCTPEAAATLLSWFEAAAQ